MGKQKDSVSRLLVHMLGPLLFLAAGGCANARIVREGPEGGVVAIPMNNNCWPMYYRNRAEKLMDKICPDGYQIEREEFVFDGKPGPEGHRAHESYFGYTDPNDETGPYLRKEYWIAFSPAPSGNRNPDQAAPATPTPSSPPSEREEELPPPRPTQGE